MTPESLKKILKARLPATPDYMTDLVVEMLLSKPNGVSSGLVATPSRWISVTMSAGVLHIDYAYEIPAQIKALYAKSSGENAATASGMLIIDDPSKESDLPGEPR